MRRVWAVVLAVLGMPALVPAGLTDASPQTRYDPEFLSHAPRVTRTKDGRAGDPVNVALVGTCGEVVHAFRAAGWYPADPIRLRTALRIAGSVAFDRPYPEAPVSDLYLFGRPQDLAFQRPAGKSPRTRHHVRFWCAGEAGDGRRLWLGAATFDSSVGRSSTTGRITHHIAPCVDAERDTVAGDLERAGRLARLEPIPDFNPARNGRNGGGDCYCTDGSLVVGILTPCDQPVRTEDR
jgi:hypothetical protein